MPKGRKSKKIKSDPSQSTMASDQSVASAQEEKPAEQTEQAVSQVIPEFVRSDAQQVRPGDTHITESKISGQQSRSTENSLDNQKMESTLQEESLEFLAFKLSDEEYAVELLKITEIIRLPGITPVPRAPKTIRGIISLRGTIVPVFDLRIPLGLKELPSARKTRIVVAMSGNGVVGLWVDEVSEVVKIRVNEIEPPPSVVGGEESEHLTGVARFKGRLLILLDLEKALLLKK